MQENPLNGWSLLNLISEPVLPNCFVGNFKSLPPESLTRA